ncbi:DNA repair protein RecO [Jannaschia seosinensis]|uniref:DNA repair protein RecO n=1 Tax=Jannaschia seosinensis TaxID=313367 RepID=A0A0M7B907_9RHOB|nr:DNA repair protein RecO [Jannaschia seosinensis]CUH39210.1 DNA repair protein RecO [Jannaschia seosinensis]
MEWRDEGIVLAARPHGETSVILELFTRQHGRHLGVVHGGVSRRKAPMLQPGNQLDAVWRARLEGHLGSWSVELMRSRAAGVLSDPLRLAALSATCALCAFVLPEREALAEFQIRTEDLCDAIVSGEGWLNDYVFWEAALLEVAGFRLDLGTCGATGTTEDLVYVSPRSGRAVSRAGAGEWASRLLALPEMLTGAPPSMARVVAALDLTGFFLSEKVAASLGNRPLPAARARLVDALRGEA